MNLSRPKVLALKVTFGYGYASKCIGLAECELKSRLRHVRPSKQFLVCYSTSVRVRFAPSPTGFLHLGGLRTALYNYLFAKSQNGSFILRIEDTDRTRIVPDSMQSIERDLAWTNIIPDESPTKNGGFGPYIQSERNHLYKLYIEELLQKGFAYRCFCSTDRIQQLRQLSKGLSYDNLCRSLAASEVTRLLSNGKPYCVRFKVNINDIEPFRDLIFGLKNISLSDDEGDFILLKSDGIPTYHFANVVDDHLMKISHVLRGSEWLPSTPKHLLIYKSLDSELEEMYIKSVLHWSRERIDKWMDLAEEKYNYLWVKPDSDAVLKGILKLNISAKVVLTEVISTMSKLKCEEVKEEELKYILMSVTKENKLKTVNFMKLMRISICGVTEGPPVVEIIRLLGHRRSLQRLQDALQLLS